jgi:uncharacterized membrane protein YhfC/ABC-type transport system involved in multi-copper enzyme maturation permease subunit
MHALAYGFSIGLTIIIPLVLAVILRRRFRVSWFLFGVGSLTFIGSQVIHLPLNNLLSKLGILPGSAPQGWALLAMALILGLTAGLCEELARALGYYLLKSSRRFADGVMLGLGHGGIEAMILVGILAAGTIGQLFALRGTDLSSLGMSSAQLTYITGQMEIFNRSPLNAFMPLLERLIAMTLHVVLSMMVLHAFQTHKSRWVVAAILYHAIVDAVAVLLASSNTSGLVMEGVFLITVIPGLIWVIEVFGKQARETGQQVLPIEWSLFWQSFRKEMIQLNRTKMTLVILAVFALFGIASPLLAYFMPQIIGSVEGAEMFKDLIPTPSIKDALEQYLKNISQFGFLIAILVGMGQVASEKERGTTEMILNKPLPRWAFILSKFTAQAVVYVAAFAIAELFAYGYTIYLFETFSLAVFTLLNFLLLMWLLCFVAITTLASTVSKGIGMAAGFSLAGAVVILLSVQIPKYGAISPQALMNWAGLLAQDQIFNIQTSNFTALGMAVVLIIMAMVWAVGLFERQEI